MRSMQRVLILLALVVSTELFGQVEGTMPFMTSLSQVTYYNPAFRPSYKVSVGLPISSLFVQYSNNGFTYNDFVKNQVADVSRLFGAMKPQNYINANLQADLFRVTFKVNPRIFFTANITAKGYNRLMLPKDVVGVLANGTDPYINNKATLSPKGEAMEYIEMGYGASYVVNRKLTLGAKLKFLKGAMNATTQKAVFDMSLSDTYAITVKGDADIRTSGIHNLNQSGYSINDHWKDYLKNNGFAIDLGGTYEVNDKLMVGLSLIDLGGINWKNDPYGYKLDPSKAVYTFEGVKIQDVLDGNSNYTSSLSDSLKKKFEFTEGKISSYRTPLPGKIYLSGSYSLHRSVKVGGLFFAEKFRGRFMPGFSTSLHKEFGRRLSTSLSYTITNHSYKSLGAGISLNLPPIQIYIVGDNLLSASFAAMRKDLDTFANNAHFFNLRTGINFVFGWDKSSEKKPNPKTPKSGK